MICHRIKHPVCVCVCVCGKPAFLDFLHWLLPNSVMWFIVSGVNVPILYKVIVFDAAGAAVCDIHGVHHLLHLPLCTRVRNCGVSTQHLL